MPLPRLPKRKRDAHKGDFGTVLVIAGSRGMLGAAILASQAALRSGAGKAVLVVPDSIVPSAMAAQICATVRGAADNGRGAFDEDAAEVIAAIPGDVALIGPGISTSAAAMVRRLVPSLSIPCVLDADALLPDLPPGGARVITPHPGEMKRLLGRPVADREADAREAARRFQAVCLLKGHRTVVTDGTRVHVNRTGNPGMATGGSGDVLGGVIAALVGQGLAPYDAAVLGAHVHGLAGDLAAKEKGEISMIATDILEALPQAFRRLK